MANNEYKLQLDNGLILNIMDNCFGNIFVVDSNGVVLFANQNCVTAFGVPRERIIGHTTKELIESGILSRSTSQECLEKRETIIGTVSSQLGVEMLNISKPVYNQNGDISFIMTYGQRSDAMGEFLDAIQDEKNKVKGYKDALRLIGGMENVNHEIIIVSEKMKNIFSQIDRVAPTDGTIMLYGESGVGKDVIANYVHKASSRKDEPFIPVNCAAIPRELMESEFFGYEKGAFTGARNQGKAGLFEVANKGTIFLDEIGELPLDMQAKFLRVIETGMFTRIGGHKQLKTDVRLIAATNRNLRQMMQDKLFREDLYFRLNVLSFIIPPLRERKEAIGDFVNAFLKRYNKKYGKNVSVSPIILDQLIDYPWYGNVRELKNVIERMVLTSNNDYILNEFKDSPFDIALPPHAVNENSDSTTQNINENCNQTSSVKNLYKEQEKKRILEVLLSVNGNKSKAAQLLGMSRGKLYKLLEE